MDYTEIRQKLSKLAEPEYQKFASSLLPETKNILGVRLPYLRKIAKQLAREGKFPKQMQATNISFEEIMLQGMVIGYIEGDFDTIQPMIKDFVPAIDNWSVCDSFCSGLKITNQYPAQMWNLLQDYLYSDGEFEARFGVVMLLNYFIKKEYLTKIFSIFDRITQDGYYCKMAVAWAISICYVKFPQETMTYLLKNELDEFTYLKALQKITESRQVSAEAKKIIQRMKKEK